MAARTDTTLQQSLYATGTHPGSPVPFLPASTGITVRPTMTDQTARDPANTLTVVVKAAYDPTGKDLAEETRFSWRGDPADDAHNPGHPGFPSMPLTFTVKKPAFVAADLILPDGVILSVGIVIDQA